MIRVISAKRRDVRTAKNVALAIHVMDVMTMIYTTIRVSVMVDAQTSAEVIV